MDKEFERLIELQMEKTKGNQMTEDEYRYVASFLGSKNFLVFGLGYDSQLWRYANRNGFTIFLEHDPKWITSDSDVYQVSYRTRLTQADSLLVEYDNGNFQNLLMSVPEVVLNTKWDCIFVDSPQGFNEKCPGRMQSIFMASKLARCASTNVFVHDCDRRVEDLYTRKLFSQVVTQLTKLRHVKNERS